MTSKYEFIDAEYATDPAAETVDAPTITQMCAWLEVSIGSQGRGVPKDPVP